MAVSLPTVQLYMRAVLPRETAGECLLVKSCLTGCFIGEFGSVYFCSLVQG